jgi:hypothetical protein
LKPSTPGGEPRLDEAFHPADLRQPNKIKEFDLPPIADSLTHQPNR